MHPVAKKVLLHGVLPVSLACAVILGAGSFYASGHGGHIFPGVYVGPVDVGGLTHEQAATKVFEATQKAVEDGLVVSLENNLKTIPLITQGVNDPDASFDLVSFDVDGAVSQATIAGRENGIFISMLAPMVYGLGFRHTIHLSSTIDNDRIAEAMDTAFPGVNTPAVDAGFTISAAGSSWKIEVTPSRDGQVMETATVLAAMDENLESTLTLPPLAITLTKETALLKTEDAEGLVEKAMTALEAAPYALTFAPPDTEPTIWPLSAQDLAGFLYPEVENGRIALGLDETMIDLINERTKTVVRPPTDAKFAIENGKVTEFQGASGGWIIDAKETIEQIESVLGEAGATSFIVANYEDASVQTSDVNDLGITEILGVGQSNFSGSPTNRVKNIKNGARLLNGTLIKPGDTFSLLDTLGPFTTENGYLPELVIKGDKIQPEIGGGLCQIGTTTFRGTMEAGLPVIERRNHSLVVSYYNDPRNGSPGTDATIYDPSPDYKFLNDTGHYILITTDVNTTTGDLTFTFWGTSDGREGSYSEPIVSSWIGAGPTRNIETLDLAPGTVKCQHAYPGANASFVYTVTQADGTVDEETFTSNYRALPEICLVGVEKLSEPIDEATDETEPSAAEESQTPLATDTPSEESKDPIPSEETTTP